MKFMSLIVMASMLIMGCGKSKSQAEIDADDAWRKTVLEAQEARKNNSGKRAGNQTDEVCFMAADAAAKDYTNNAPYGSPSFENAFQEAFKMCKSR